VQCKWYHILPLHRHTITEAIELVEHTYALVLPSSRSPTSPTGLAQVLALVKRSDSVSIKSEGSRVLVNVVKSLWSSNLPASPVADSQPSPIAAGTVNKEDLLEKQRKRNAAIRTVLTPECTSMLASLVGRSGKYPLLVNEGVVALSLLSTSKEGGMVVFLFYFICKLICLARTACSRCPHGPLGFRYTKLSSRPFITTHNS